MTKLNLGPYSSNWSANSVYLTGHKHEAKPTLTQKNQVEETAKRGEPRGHIARAHKCDLTNG